MQDAAAAVAVKRPAFYAFAHQQSQHHAVGTIVVAIAVDAVAFDRKYPEPVAALDR